MAKIYFGRRCREKSAKGKGAGGEVWGNQGRSLFSQQRTCFITPVTSCGYMWDLMSARKADQRLRAQGSTRGWSQTHIPSVWYGAKIQAPRRKKVLSINHNICAKILGTVRQPYQLDQRRPSQNPRSQMSVKGQSCKQAIARLQSQVCWVCVQARGLSYLRSHPPCCRPATLLPVLGISTQRSLAFMLPAPCASHTQKLLHDPGVTSYSAFSSLKTLSHSPLNALPPAPSFIFISLRLSLRKEPLYLFLICSLVPPLLELSSLRAEKCMFCLLCHLLGLTQNWQLVGAHLINICHTGIVNNYETFSSS